MTPIEKLGVEISDFLEQNALVWPNSLRQAWDAAKDAELDKESWAQICDQFDAENPHIGQAAEVAKLLRSNAELRGRTPQADGPVERSGTNLSAGLAGEQKGASDEI